MLREVKIWLCIACFGLAGCGTVPRRFLKLPDTYIQKRQLQMRQYDTTDEVMIISAVAGVLQDLDFTLDESETELGLVSASKKADATDSRQVFGAFLLDLFSALAGNSNSAASSKVDAVQYVRASVIVKPSLSADRTVVRVTFQRMVWNASNELSRVETLSDPEIYQRFFDSLSKAIFLEAHSI